MHWFIDEMLWRGFIYIRLNMIVCNILQEHKNKYYVYLFASPKFTGLRCSFDIHIVSQYLMSNGGGCEIWFYRYVELLNKTSTPYLLVVKGSTATMSVRSWHLYIQYVISGNKTVTLQPRLPLAVRRKSSKSTSLKPIHKNKKNTVQKASLWSAILRAS